MSDLVRRVARRFSSKEKTAGFIPDRFWKAKKAELRTLLSTPLLRSDPYDISYALEENLLPFFVKVVDELKGFGLNTQAEISVGDRLDTVKHVIGKMVSSYQAFAAQTNVKFPSETVEEEITWLVATRVQDALSKGVKTLADAMKAQWKVDKRLIQAVAGRILKKATPAEVEAIDHGRDSNRFDNRSMEVKWGFFQRVNLDKLSKGLVTKEKLTYDLIRWLELLQGALGSYTQTNLEENDGLTEFELYRMKVVVDDDTVDSYQTKSYVRLLDAAYHMLNAKKLGKAWYGTVFIRCKDCGGENQHGKELGVGGHYHIGPNTVTIYSRPSKFIIELMAHELGHRYWFKHMTSEQRARFTDLVSLTGEGGVAPVSDYGKTHIDEAFAEAFAHYVLEKDMNRDQLESFRSVISSAAQHVAQRYLSNVSYFNKPDPEGNVGTAVCPECGDEVLFRDDMQDPIRCDCGVLVNVDDGSQT